MGGSHEHSSLKIPDYRIYKVADVPQLAQVERALAAQGLKDPWLRNEVWRFDERYWGSPLKNAKQLIFRGFKFGFTAFLITIAGTALYDKMHPDEHGHGGH